jgi:acyl-CoA thioester hydrolase
VPLMPKIKLKQQDAYEFEYPVTLQVYHINYGGHLGNDTVVSLLHEARVNLLKQLGLTELNLGDGKTGIIMADLAVNYLKEGFLFDQFIIFTHIDEISAASFRIFHKIMKDDIIIALAEIGIITFDYHEHAITEIPTDFLNVLNDYLKCKRK